LRFGALQLGRVRASIVRGRLTPSTILRRLCVAFTTFLGHPYARIRLASPLRSRLFRRIILRFGALQLGRVRASIVRGRLTPRRGGSLLVNDASTILRRLCVAFTTFLGHPYARIRLASPLRSKATHNLRRMVLASLRRRPLRR
jgi:hypothetical protein